MTTHWTFTLSLKNITVFYLETETEAVFKAKRWEPFLTTLLLTETFTELGLYSIIFSYNATCPVVNLSKFSFIVSVCFPHHTGCQWLFTSNYKFWSWHSRPLWDSCDVSAGYALFKLASVSSAIQRHLSTPISRGGVLDNSLGLHSSIRNFLCRKMSLVLQRDSI